MKSKAIVAILLAFLLFHTPNAEAINVTIEGEHQLYGGDVATYFINISTTRSRHINLTPLISPSIDGFSVSFSDNNFTLNGVKTVTMTVVIGQYVLGEYTIGINCTYSKSEGKEKSKRIFTSSNDQTTENEDTTDNNETDDTDITPPNNETNDNDDNDNNNNTENITTIKKEKENINLFTILIPIVLIILLFCIALIKRRNKK